MRTPIIFSILLVLALALAGCSAASLPGQLSSITHIASNPSSSTTTVAQDSPSTTMSSDPTTAAIQTVIQQADKEQQQALAQKDPTVMRDTATADYYDQMVQVNSDLSHSGVSSIKLAKIDWGQITINGDATAQATAYETWDTYLSDGSMFESTDTNNYTLVQDQGTWKIQNDDHPDSNQNQAPGASAPAPSQSVPPGSLVPVGRSDSSPNWSGYSANHGTYTAVSGTWTVPQSSSTGGFASDATWVGIGGVTSRDLIQSGTMETTGHSQGVGYEAWIEMLPQASQTIPIAVNPGDSVTVSISEQKSNNWLITFKNNTTHQTYQTTVQYTSSRSSAEWVVEAPSVGRQILPLDNFGAVQFSNGSATENGKSVTIAQTGAQPITMRNFQGSAIASPTALTPDGQGFSVGRTGSAATAQPIPGFGGMPSTPRRFRRG